MEIHESVGKCAYEEANQDPPFNEPSIVDQQLDAHKNCRNVENFSLTTGQCSLTNCETMAVVDVGENTNLNDCKVDTFSPSITCCEVRHNDCFFKGCKWSPDDMGNRILTSDGDNKLRVYHCFLNKINYASSQFSNDYVQIHNVGTIFDFDWYPILSPSNYYVMIASSLGPLHIYDLAIQKCVSTYQMFSLKDEAVHANCVTCFPDGNKILGATTDYIFLFDVNRPGRTYERIPSRRYFKKGILSSITVNPMRYSMFAVGSYNHRIGIYDESKLLCLLHGHTKGITHLKFSPDGLLLYSGARGSGEMICWDLRNPGTALYKLERVVKTQQRIYFDITSDSRYVFSGSTDGSVYIWDTTSPPCNNILSPMYKFQAHQDCTNGISVHPRLPFIATVSGQYHTNDLLTLLRQYDSDNDHPDFVLGRQENSLKLWHVKF